MRWTLNSTNHYLFLSIEYFRIPKLLFDGLDVYVQHYLNIVPWNRLVLETVLKLKIFLLLHSKTILTANQNIIL